MPRFCAGLCLAVSALLSTPLLASEQPNPSSAAVSARLSYLNPDDLLVDSLVSQTGRIVTSFVAYESAHGLHSSRELTFQSVLAGGQLTQVPRPPQMVSSEPYRFEPLTGRVVLGLNQANQQGVCGVINDREPGHCVIDKGEPTYWEEVGPVISPGDEGI